MIQLTAETPIRSSPVHRFNPAINNRPSVPVLVVVEGVHDVEFLRRLTARLHVEDASFPDLAVWEQQGLVIFIPFGGGGVLAWSSRFAPLGCPEMHLYDREIEPETALRQQAVDRINARPDCRALLLSKRSLENYLHRSAITNAGGGIIEVNDTAPLAMLVAEDWYFRQPHTYGWDELPLRTRRRQMGHAKRWLNTQAVDAMTLRMLSERDQTGELMTWLRKIAYVVDDF